MATVLAVTAAALTLTAVAAAAFRGSTTNSATFGAGSVVVHAVAATGAGCTSSPSTVSSDAATCTGTTLPAGPLSTTTATATTKLSEVGAVTPSAGSVSLLSCGLESVRSTATSNDPGLVYNGVTYRVPGPQSATALAFTGASSAYVATALTSTDPQSLSEVAWFKAPATGYGGSILGFTNVQASTAPSAWDRQIWMDATGHIVFGIYPGRMEEVTSGTRTYDDTAWHMVVASFGAAGTQLWVDGTEVGHATTTTAAQNYRGWWHIGYSHAHSSWTDGPTSTFWNGDLARVAIVPSQLTGSQISSLYGAATISAYTAALTAVHPSASWLLDDTGTTPYVTAFPGIVGSGSTYADASGNGDTGTGHGALAATAAGPLGSGALSFKGGASTYVSTATSFTDPGATTVVAWFKAPATTFGGNLIGFTNLQTNAAPSTWDRQIWMDSSGHLVFGVYPTAVKEVKSPTAYDDGQWHMVVASYGAAGEQLWVDGTRVAQTSGVTRAQNFRGYWHIGYSHSTTGWTDGPTRSTWDGTLAQVAVVPSQLSGAQIAALHGAATAAAFAAALKALSPSAYWPLTATGASAPSLCATVMATVQSSVGSATTCAYPAGAGTCPAPTSGHTLSGITTASVAPATLSAAQTVAIRLRLAATPPADQRGLHLLADFQFEVTQGSWSATVRFPAASVRY